MEASIPQVNLNLYLADEGIRHEFTIPHTPEQNGVSERLNRTLIESVRSMLADSKLPHQSGLKHYQQQCIFETEVPPEPYRVLLLLKRGMALNLM